jgi:hypothetical protein
VPGFVQQVVCALLNAVLTTTVIALTRKRLLVKRRAGWLTNRRLRGAVVTRTARVAVIAAQTSS